MDIKGHLGRGVPRKVFHNIPYMRPKDTQNTAVSALVLKILLSETAYPKCQLCVIIKFKSTLKFKEETDEV